MQEIKIGLLGLGNVGTGVYRILQHNGEEIYQREGLRIKISKILVRDVSKHREISVDPSLLTSDINDILLNQNISIIVESMGGVDPAKQYIETALKNKKTVVTANKEVIAKYGSDLEKIARENNTGLYYEASVAGGIPIIRVLSESLQANRIYEIMGIINGTTNYILTKMSDDGRSFQDVLAEAQKLGYAEPDPTADIEGFDAMYKLSILSSIAFSTNVTVEDIYCEGITKITSEDIEYGRELGYTLRLLAIAKRTEKQIDVRVHPTFIPVDHPLASVRDSYNAVFIKGDAVGNLMFYGRGAGSLPTGSAIVSDIITACHRLNRHQYTLTANSFQNHADIELNNDWETEFFVHLRVVDKPGVLAKIAGIFAKYNVSIASVIQKYRNDNAVPLIFVTHRAKELSMKKAIQDIQHEQDIFEVKNVIRVDK